jgi:hypothetical protein
MSQGRVLTDFEANQMIAEGMGEMHQEDFPVLSYVGFQTIMTHAKNDGYDPLACIQSGKDLSHPLQHYFISSSDGAAVDMPVKESNPQSLLEGDLRPNPYVTALQMGCRALELRVFEEKINPQGEQTDIYVGNPRLPDRVTFKGNKDIYVFCFSTFLL